MANPNPADIKLKIADFGFARFLQVCVYQLQLSCNNKVRLLSEDTLQLLRSFNYGSLDEYRHA